MATFSKYQNIADYSILFFIKQGAYAETYRVKDNDGNLLFLKLINLSKLQSAQFDENGKVLEVEISKQLHHANTCNYVSNGIIVHNGQKFSYIVYDFISGETVAEKCIREQRCSVYDTKQIAISVLNALNFLHERENPIIHNEVTSQNIMLDMSSEQSVPKLIDFGWAQFLNSPTQKINLEHLNPFYLAPERFNGVSSAQSDLYSVGVLIYHLLFGQVPWYFDLSRIEPGQRINVLLAQKQSPLKMLNTNMFELDEQMINTMVKATSYEVEERFQSADEFISALNGDLIVHFSSSIVQKESNPTLEKKGNGFDDIAGMDSLKQMLRDDVIDMINNPDVYKNMNLPMPNGMLFYGPPGCGKTFFAQKFAEEVGSHFMYIKCSDIAAPYIHGGQTKIAGIFDEARNNAPTILFLDEIDALVTDRDKQNTVSESGEVNEFLTQMNNCGESDVFVIGATNKPENIDKAALRGGRLEKHVYISNPDFESRKALFKLYLKKRSDFGIDYDMLASKTENYVSVDIKLITDTAARKAIHLKQNKITNEILNEVLADFEPTVSNEEIHKYELLRDRFEGKHTKDITRKPIGFK